MVLFVLFGDVKVHCDHDPALEHRRYFPRRKKIADRYEPNANDPAFLVYRVVRDEGPATLEPGPLSHHVKTNVRGENGKRSDTAERVHRRRVEKNRPAREAVRAGRPKRRRNKIVNKKRRKCRWRPGRKLRGRNTFEDRRSR